MIYALLNREHSHSRTVTVEKQQQYAMLHKYGHTNNQVMFANLFYYYISV